MNYKKILGQDSVKLGIFIGVIALILRLVPELLTGHYPIGYDTLTFYTTVLADLTNHTGNYLTISTLANQNILYSIFQVIYSIRHFNIFHFLKFFGVGLYVLLALSTYLMFLRGMKFNAKKSFYITLFYILSLAALRVSWDLFRNELSLIFLNLFLIGLFNLVKRFDWRYFVLALVSVILVFVSHQIVSLLLLFLLLCLAFSYLTSKLTKALQFIPIFIFILLICLSPIYLNFKIHGLGLFDQDSVSLFKNQAGHIYVIIFGTALPFVLIGLINIFQTKKEQLYIYAYWFIGLSLITIEPYLFPTKIFFLWDRWLYMLALPIAVLAYYGVSYLARLKVFLPLASEAVILFFIIAINYQSIPFALSKPGIGAKIPSGAAFPQALAWNSIGEVGNDDIGLLIKQLNTYPFIYVLIADNRFSGVFATKGAEFLGGNSLIYTYGPDTINLSALKQSNMNGYPVLVFDANEILSAPGIKSKIIYQTNTPGQIHRYLYELDFSNYTSNN